MKQLFVMMLLAANSFAAHPTPVRQAPSTSDDRQNPLEPNEVNRKAGAKIFSRECAACHGSAGQGRQKALPLDSREVQDASSGRLFWVLTNGSLRHGMPSFASLPEPQRWQVTTFLKTLPRSQ